MPPFGRQLELVAVVHSQHADISKARGERAEKALRKLRHHLRWFLAELVLIERNMPRFQLDPIRRPVQALVQENMRSEALESIRSLEKTRINLCVSFWREAVDLEASGFRHTLWRFFGLDDRVMVQPNTLRTDKSDLLDELDERVERGEMRLFPLPEGGVVGDLSLDCWELTRAVRDAFNKVAGYLGLEEMPAHSLYHTWQTRNKD
ncbi:hypothetical protein QBC47DRAFT_430597 [Echria macrotheca]|uniref:Uncharacterized protein n=1 Tax=Echria macrotheca TaxID=438768 RepID=A0AAJ0BBI4_9PEZI|nr:hypothetical protein QBC47DRAFT_430597 [Echria macrotheca]